MTEEQRHPTDPLRVFIHLEFSKDCPLPETLRWCHLELLQTLSESHLVPTKVLTLLWTVLLHNQAKGRAY